MTEFVRSSLVEARRVIGVSLTLAAGRASR
jgi:hypothetical protein